jgi:hypothetical protein
LRSSAICFIEWDPYQANVDQIFSKIIYFANKLSRNNKIEIFEEKLKNYPDLVWAKYILSCFKLQEGNFQQSFNLIQSINPDDYGDFGPALPKIAAHIVEICHKAHTNCETIVQNIHSARKFNFWNEVQYNQQLKLYQLNPKFIKNLLKSFLVRYIVLLGRMRGHFRGINCAQNHFHSKSFYRYSSLGRNKSWASSN